MLFERIYESIKDLGLQCTFKEVLRRLFHRKYSCREIIINSDEDFRVLRGLVRRGFKIDRGSKALYVRVITDYGIIEVPIKDFNLLSPLTTDKDRLYGVTSIRNNIIIDVGGYIGDTALYFASRGANKVIVYEPIKYFYMLLEHNLKINNVKNVNAYNMGIWFEKGIIKFLVEGAKTGLSPYLWNNKYDKHLLIEEVKLIPLNLVLLNISKAYSDKEIIMKMDCMGCEYSIITVGCDLLKLINTYIVKIYGAPNPILWKFSKCGFNIKNIFRHVYLITQV